MKKFFLILLLIVNQCFSSTVKRIKENDSNSVIKFVKDLLPTNPIILEAGAFNGADTKKMSRAWPKGKIYAFEPVPEIYSWLYKNTRNIHNIKTFKLALSDFNGKGFFYPSKLKNTPYASGSILQPKEHLNFAKDIQFSKPISVEMITLDHWAKKNKIKNIDFLWLDMQGFELNVLMASEEILKTVKIIYTEVEFVEAYSGQYLYKDVKKFLETNGFDLIAKDFDDEQAENKDIKINQRWYGNAIFHKKL